MPGRILIADDVATNRIILKVKLSAASYKVIQAKSGQQVLEYAEMEAPNLCILDVTLPDIDGITLCQRLRANPATQKVPIILVSTQADDMTRLAAFAAGADDFLVKPFDDLALMARVRNILRARVVGEELRLREATALELGFAEADAGFLRQGVIGLIAQTKTQAVEWCEALDGQPNSIVKILPKASVLNSGDGPKPDVFVISANLDHPGEGLTLLAELRSRDETRHASIVVLVDPDDKSSTIGALDIGANDLVPNTCTPNELALRVARQLAQKLQSDRLRDTVENGLKMAMIDPLTGLFNRRYAVPHLSRIAARSAVNGRQFAIMVLDLDHFKRINDTYGHPAGDTVLAEVAKRIKSNTRSVDLVARIGGEEFMVVMPDTGLTCAQAAAERLRRVVGDTGINLPDNDHAILVTLSIGVSIGGQLQADPMPIHKLVDQADRALLGAKAVGRNQVIVDQSAA